MVKIRIVPRPWKPSQRNLVVLAAVCATGSRKDAALALVDEDHPNGISARTVGQHMRLLQAGSHAVSDAQLCLIYHAEIQPYLNHAE